MKRYVCGLAALIVLSPSMAFAETFFFSGSDAGGTGSAVMNFSGIGTSVLTVTLENTSPLTLDDGTGTNAPGITGFGFDGSDPLPNLTGWSLVAKDANGDDVLIGSSDGTSTGDWILGTTQAGVTLDYLPQADQGVKGALYNPDQTSGLAALPNYFTTATLVLEFDDSFNPDFSSPQSPHVRMQNVGEGGGGSLKLPGDPRDPPPDNPVPEPTTLFLFGTGLMACGLAKRRKANAA